MSDDVQSIRDEIDQLDKDLYQLLVRRAELAQQIGMVKKKQGMAIIHPDREVALLRKILERGQNKFPEKAVARIWRELIGSVTQIQTNMKVAVTALPDENGIEHVTLAKDYFATTIPIQRTNDAMSTLSMVREQDVTMGVVPWPADNTEKDWWPFLLDEQGQGALKIIARLPVGNSIENRAQQSYQALALARLPFQETGNDRSFLAMDLKSTISRGRIADKAEALGLKPLAIYTVMPGHEMTPLYLVEVEGYVSEEDERLKELLENLECFTGRIVSVGGYPTPLEYKEYK